MRDPPICEVRLKFLDEMTGNLTFRKPSVSLYRKQTYTCLWWDKD